MVYSIKNNHIFLSDPQMGLYQVLTTEVCGRRGKEEVLYIPESSSSTEDSSFDISTFVGEVLPLCWDAAVIFYRTSLLGFLYIYVCVCVMKRNKTWKLI